MLGLQREFSYSACEGLQVNGLRQFYKLNFNLKCLGSHYMVFMLDNEQLII